MPNEMQASRSKILHTLLRSDTEAGMRLSEIAAAVALTPPTVLDHLHTLRDQGFLTLSVGPGSPGTRYRAAHAFHGLWIDPDRRLIDQWTATGPVDWRFPLVARVPDAALRSFLVEWLDRAEARRLLPDARSRFEPTDPPPPRLSIVAYGSRARGDAHLKADADLLVTTDRRWPGTEDLVHAAHETALNHPFPLDVSQSGQGSHALPAPLLARIRIEGKTVYTNDPSGPFLETLEDHEHA